MDTRQAIQLADDVLRLGGAPPWQPDIGEHFADYAKDVLYAARQVPKDDRPHWFGDWARTFRGLYDDFEKMRAADPMLAYRPRNPASLAFHRSRAFIRYFRAGNRTSKTQSGYAEHYYNVTGFHPYRPMPDYPASTVLVAGLPFVDYLPKIFGKKFLYGEDGPAGRNPLSPMFPEGGKWFYSFDKQRYTITIACPECANKGKAGTCPGHHVKRTISLVSAEKGKDVVEGFTARLMHGDEHLPEEFFAAMQMRVADAPGGSLIFTGTPLHGPEAWEVHRLQRIADGPVEANRRLPSDPDSVPLVEMFQCTMWDGNVVPKDVVEAYATTLDDFEKRARIDGIPAAMAMNPVFDRERLEEMQKECATPRRGVLHCPTELVEAAPETALEFQEDGRGPLRIWEDPDPNGQYVLAVDTAAGLSKRDPSCATMLKLSLGPDGLEFRQVAQYHNWITIHDYTDEVFKLALFYNSALVVIELTGGYGRAVLERLKKELFYWNIYRAAGVGEYAQFFQDARFGIDTGPYNKAAMVAVLQQVIKQRRIVVPCEDTIRELVAYEQETTDAGNPRFRGASGTHDDRVMALCIGCYVAITAQVYDPEQDVSRS